MPTSLCTIYTQERLIWFYQGLIVSFMKHIVVNLQAHPVDGRNSSTAFSLSSGTIGAALAGSMSVPLPGPSSDPSSSNHNHHIPAIAISYGVVARPSPPPATKLAHEVAVEICDHLWKNWGTEVVGNNKRPTQLYTVNIPLVEEQLIQENRKSVYAQMWRNSYGSLFKSTAA